MSEQLTRTMDVRAYLDKLGARREERGGVVDVLENLHRAHDIEPLRLPYKGLRGRMAVRERAAPCRRCRAVRERGVGCCVQRGDRDVGLGRVDGCRVCPEPCESL